MSETIPVAVRSGVSLLRSDLILAILLLPSLSLSLPDDDDADDADCWLGGMSPVDCCSASYGPRGRQECWDAMFTFERCCANSPLVVKHECAADFGSIVGDTLCCRQPGVLDSLSYACPEAVPFCHNFVQGKHWGGCTRTPPADHYAAAYDHLYEKHGYHADSELNHEGDMINRVVESAAAWRAVSHMPELRRIVVLGCSHGLGVQSLHKSGFRSWGVDVARKAIEDARRLRGSTCGGHPDDCFALGSLTKMPFEANAFDAALSVDVLEHLAPADVPAVVAEITRTVAHYLFLEIMSVEEKCQSGERAGMGNLHLTTEGALWWRRHFVDQGWWVVEDFSDSMHVKLILQKHQAEPVPAGWHTFRNNWNCDGTGGQDCKLRDDSISTKDACVQLCAERGYPIAAQWHNERSEWDGRHCRCYSECNGGGETVMPEYPNTVMEVDASA